LPHFDVEPTGFENREIRNCPEFLVLRKLFLVKLRKSLIFSQIFLGVVLALTRGVGRVLRRASLFLHPTTMESTMKFAAVAAMASIMMMAGQSHAADEEALAKSKNCLTCHAVDKKLVGPAYKDIAAKYKGDSSAPAKLAAKVKAGGKGAWGEMPMPPNNVTDDEASRLVAWVLSQK
jgi:cytochrome c